MRQDPVLLALIERLHHPFEDLGLLELALTHSSADGRSHQRLEFLGDAVLATVVSQHLFEKHPDWDQGALSVARTAYVSKGHLVRVAGALNLGPALRIRADVLKSGPVQSQASVLADTVEALIGAVFLDAGLGATRTFIENHVLALAPEFPEKDPKTALQEWCQSKRWRLPNYQVLAQTGSAHAPQFEVQCVVVEADLVANAHASSRKEAERAAAWLLLQQLQGAGR